MDDTVNTHLERVTVSTNEQVGAPFMLILVYLFMEYIRPVNPMKIPMLISIVLFIGWAMLPKKHWNPQIVCFAAMIGVIGVMGPFALNSYAIFWGFVGIVVQLYCICVPIMHFVDSEKKLKWFIDALMLMFVYIAIFAMLHGGFGPGGHVGDENDVALAINSILPFAFLSIFVSSTRPQKIWYGVVSAILLAGVIASKSRGGFLGLLCVSIYCFILTPNKLQSLGIGLLLSGGVALFAPDEYWEEISTIWTEAENEDPRQGTGALRKLYWTLALEMFYANPIFGVGLGNFAYNAELYQTAEMYEQLGRTVGSVTHSLYFAILAETGAAGTLVFTALVYYNFKGLGNLIRKVNSRLKSRHLIKNSDPLKRVRTPEKPGNEGIQVPHTGGDKALLYYSHATRAGLIGFLSSGVFVTVFTYPHFWILTAITVVLVVLAEKQSRLTIDPVPSAVTPPEKNFLFKARV
jgi:O-antigen ligase